MTRLRETCTLMEMVMENHNISKLCISRAGHDTGKLYAVIAENEEFCFLSDGKIRTLDKLKKKRKKHVQMITHLDDELLVLMSQVKQDSDLIHILTLYSRQQG